MEYKWRGWSKAVACIDLFLSGILLLLISIGLITLFIYAVDEKKVPKFYNPATGYALSRTSTISFGGIILVVLSILPAFQFWGSLKLLGATDSRENPSSALEKVQIWINVRIIILLITIIYSVFEEGLVFILFQGVGIYIVYNFMFELTSAA